MKLAYADRSKYLGDPDFTEVPVARLTDEGLRPGPAPADRAGRGHARDGDQARQALRPESRQTTHYSVVDRKTATWSPTPTP